MGPEIFRGFLYLVAVALLLPAFYLLFLTLVGLLYRPPGRGYPGPRYKFAILVPAHNEELVLPRLLESLGKVNYPRELFHVFVVADNCSDATAEVARRYQATVFERADPLSRGKGYALQWVLHQLRDISKEYDAYIFLDADSVVSPDFLAAMDARFQSGSIVVQGHYVVSAPFRTPLSALRFIAFVLKHYVRPKGRQVLGLSCGLFGTGMGFGKTLLDTYGWDAFGLAEDAEYHLKLVDRGVKVDFAPEATVWSPMPGSFREARSQNLRWEKGRLQLVWRSIPPLFRGGLWHGQWKRLDAVLEQAIPPLSIFGVMVLAFLLVALIVNEPWLIAAGLGTLVALSCHIFVGLVSARVPLRTYLAFFYAPWFVLWKLYMYLLALRPGQVHWVRTGRPEERGSPPSYC